MSATGGKSPRGLAPERRPESSPESAARRPFLESAASGYLVLDAAMGTRLMARGLDPGLDDPALWNRTHADEVLAIHRRDVAAGAGALVANTFGASRAWLRRFGRHHELEAINRAAIGLAREASRPGRFVLGGIGPAAALELGAAAEQAAILVDAGADALIFETYRLLDLERVLAEVSQNLAIPVPLVASLWEWPDPAGPAARRLLAAGASVIGMNCQPGIGAALEFADRLRREVECPLLVKPSAGAPGRIDDRPAAFAAAVPRLLRSRVRFLGGCCGTTEAHVAALAAACAAADRTSCLSLVGEKS